ncbi:MAG: hypothetical protein V3S50_13290 [Acidobacteriota bacterium]
MSIQGRRDGPAPTVPIIAITFGLFAAALLTKGFTHDLLLEAGVFLVSVKLIVMAYKNAMASKKIMKELHAIKKIMGKTED